MKKTIVVLVMLGTSIYTNAFATFDRKTENGGQFGFKSTSKVDDGRGNVTIRCNDPGFTPCPESMVKASDRELYDYAISNIRSGIFNGEYSIGGSTVSWTTDNERMTNSHILILEN